MTAVAAPSPRLVTVDALRGFALLGILQMNIQTFAFAAVAYVRPTLAGPLEGFDLVAWVFTHVFGDLKFLSLYALLFGAGVAWATARPTDLPRFRARQLWLFVFGVLHAYLLWYGDILFTHGIVGWLVLGARNWPSLRLRNAGILCLAVSVVLTVLFEVSLPAMPSELQALVWDGYAPSASALAAEVAVYRGPWLGQLATRALTAFEQQTLTFVVQGGWRAAAFVLLGMSLAKASFFEGKTPDLERRFVRWGFGLGLPLAGLSAFVLVRLGFPPRSGMSLGLINYVASIGVALGLAGAFLRIARVAQHTAVFQALAAAGRMSLTHYISQTLICTMLFYGAGLGSIGTWSRWALVPLAAAIWLVQVVCSPLLLRWWGQGPLERLWRWLATKTSAA